MKSKIYWINDDPNAILRKEILGLTSGQIIIKINKSVIEAGIEADERNYKLALKSADSKTFIHSGMAFIVSCRKFDGENAFTLFGKWLEDSATYTWWAVFDKS